jgi:hypothetical protein
MQSDIVRVSDSGRLLLNKKEAYLWGDEKSVVEVKGWVTTLFRERGKIVPGSRRSGHNIWTNTGREYLAMLMTLKDITGAAYRSDRIAYIGIGRGAQIEDVGVTALTEPVVFTGSSFLAPIEITATYFPLLPSRTSVRYTRTFGEYEITVPGQETAIISELGLFTNGNRTTFEVSDTLGVGRDTSIVAAAEQAPVAYKSLVEPVEKTNGLEFQVEWEVRF